MGIAANDLKPMTQRSVSVLCSHVKYNPANNFLIVIDILHELCLQQWIISVVTIFLIAVAIILPFVETSKQNNIFIIYCRLVFYLASTTGKYLFGRQMVSFHTFPTCILSPN